MEHATKDGQPKILKQVQPAADGRGGRGPDRDRTAVIAVTPEGLVLREVAPGVTPADVQKVTEPKLRVRQI